MIATLSVALAALAALAGPGPAAADRPLLHPLFTDHAVLQRDMPVPVWGWAEPGAKLRVAMAGQSAEATADASGRWMARLGPLAAGGPHTLSVTGPKSAEVKDILVGDVWICSGQSNMEWPVAASNRADEEVAGADNPKLRLFAVPKKIAFAPVDTVEASWTACTPKTVGSFSAVGYFFGRDLARELDVPIGLIHSSWGGTVAEAWASGEALEAMADFRQPVAAIRAHSAEGPMSNAKYDEAMAAWWKKNDPGSADAPGWEDTKLDDASWKAMAVPGYWEKDSLPDFDGLVWFRKEVDLPEAWAGKPLKVRLGAIDDRDTTWFNGTPIGHRDTFNAARNYNVPAGVAKAGRNVLAIRVLDTGGNGGLTAKPEEMTISPADDAKAAIPLAGQWRFRDAAPLAKMSYAPQRIDQNPNSVTVLYNGMIAPLAPFAIKGAIWYQGESNVGRAAQYRKLLPTMIRDWRARFSGGEFPFLIVQLANFRARQAESAPSPWAELQEAQALISREVPKVGLAVAIDIGEANDIHPRNKQDVGKRLALNALAIGAGKGVEFSGPTYRSMTADDGSIRIRFDHAAGLASIGEGPVKGFAVAGEDGKFAWADARVDGDSVVVSSPKVAKPVAARYAWGDNPECNLANAAGLPAVPFRTDGPK